MKKLTQAVFENAPDWVKSVAVDSIGNSTGYSCHKAELMHDRLDPINPNIRLSFGAHLPPKGKNHKFVHLGKGYDTIDWQHSALDRE